MDEEDEEDERRENAKKHEYYYCVDCRKKCVPPRFFLKKFCLKCLNRRRNEEGKSNWCYDCNSYTHNYYCKHC